MAGAGMLNGGASMARGKVWVCADKTEKCNNDRAEGAFGREQPAGSAPRPTTEPIGIRLRTFASLASFALNGSRLYLAS